LAIGLCTVGFSLLDAGLLRALPVHDPTRLQWLYLRDCEQRVDSLTWIEYQALAGRTHPWDGVLAECRMGPKVRLPDRDDFPITAGVSENYFDLLGVKAAVSDVFHSGGGRDGLSGRPVGFRPCPPRTLCESCLYDWLGGPWRPCVKQTSKDDPRLPAPLRSRAEKVDSRPSGHLRPRHPRHSLATCPPDL
jgi:hypothetical protein